MASNYKAAMYALITALAVSVFVYSISDILAPFIIAMIFGYLLFPLVKRLQKLKLSRGISAALVLALGLVFLIFIALTIFPLLFQQINILITMAKSHQTHAKHAIDDLLNQIRMLNPEVSHKIQGYISSFSTKILEFISGILSSLVDSGMAVASVISLTFITPIVLFYALKEWDHIIQNLDNLIPRKIRPKFNKLFSEINTTLEGYVRGQTYVCLIMGSYYATGFTILGLNSGIVLGLICGLMTFIPYAGAVFGCTLCALVAFTQFQTAFHSMLVLGIFFIGQFIEGNFIVPKLVGASVNLHPVWIIFGLLCGGTLFGFVGILIALPLTAIVSVIIRFLIQEYKKSPTYLAG